MMESKSLVLAPHVDDEVLGLGGILNNQFHVYFCGINESHFRHDQDGTPLDVRQKELADVAAFLGFSYECNTKTKVNYFVEQDLIGVFEDLINSVRPPAIYLPHPGYNQDHRTVFDAAMVALRPHDRNYFVRKVLVYEAAHDVFWNPRPMQLNYFVRIDIDRKITAYELHKTQVRGMRTSRHLREIAAVRGAASNYDYAEAFQILRWCDNER